MVKPVAADGNIDMDEKSGATVIRNFSHILGPLIPS
jgi:hypothetical protein